MTLSLCGGGGWVGGWWWSKYIFMSNPTFEFSWGSGLKVIFFKNKRIGHILISIYKLRKLTKNPLD